MALDLCTGLNFNDITCKEICKIVADWNSNINYNVLSNKVESIKPKTTANCQAFVDYFMGKMGIRKWWSEGGIIGKNKHLTKSNSTSTNSSEYIELDRYFEKLRANPSLGMFFEGDSQLKLKPITFTSHKELDEFVQHLDAHTTDDKKNESIQLIKAFDRGFRLMESCTDITTQEKERCRHTDLCPWKQVSGLG